MHQTIKCSSREEWLETRKAIHGIGASEIGSVLGCGFKTMQELWEIKVGMVEPKDLSDNPRVQFGNDAEDALRSIFRVMHPEYVLEFTPFTILRQPGEYNFLFDTPDGWLTEINTGKRGLYESKTSWCYSKADWDKWNCKVPDGYFAQICQGMYCGEFEFAVVFAMLMDREGDATLRAYRFDRPDCEWKIEEIKSKGKRFQSFVESGIRPPLLINFT